MCQTRGQEPRPHKEFTTACNIQLISNTFIFFFFLSFYSIILFHVLAFSVIFFLFLSFSVIFFHVLSCYFSFSFFFFLSGAQNLLFWGLNFVTISLNISPKKFNFSARLGGCPFEAHWAGRTRGESIPCLSAEGRRRCRTRQNQANCVCGAPGTGPGWRCKRPGHVPLRCELRCLWPQLQGWPVSSLHLTGGSPQDDPKSGGSLLAAAGGRFCRSRGFWPSLCKNTEGRTVNRGGGQLSRAASGAFLTRTSCLSADGSSQKFDVAIGHPSAAIGVMRCEVLDGRTSRCHLGV